MCLWQVSWQLTCSTVGVVHNMPTWWQDKKRETCQELHHGSNAMKSCFKHRQASNIASQAKDENNKREIDAQTVQRLVSCPGLWLNCELCADLNKQQYSSIPPHQHIGSLSFIKQKTCLAWEQQEKNHNTPFVEANQTPVPWAENFLCKQKLTGTAANRGTVTRLVHSVVSFPAAFCSSSASSWLCASVLAAVAGEFGLPPRAAASCASRSAMRWFSFSNRTFPSWASRSQCSFSCSSRAIFSWLCCTCRMPMGRGQAEQRSGDVKGQEVFIKKWGNSLTKQFVIIYSDKKGIKIRRKQRLTNET